MKKHTIKKLFLAFSAFIMLFYSVFVFCPVSVFADSVSLTFVNNSGYTLSVRIGYDVEYSLMRGASGTYSFDVNSVYMLSVVDIRDGISFRLSYGGVFLSEDSSSPTYIGTGYSSTIEITSVEHDAFYYISVHAGYTPSPSTPTLIPTPTPTPQVASPTPDPESTGIPFPTSTNIPQSSPLTSDTEFWDRMGANANGAWGVITSTVSGIFSNVVMRNLAIYIPLFGLIVGLIIYTITLGGGDDN